jgi:hypothetical protein
VYVCERFMDRETSSCVSDKNESTMVGNSGVLMWCLFKGFVSTTLFS